ncbi:hypothetical protein SLEP1_g13323 [Rubroshorea leprosula]|uniref:Uncharacterized protein n=1 Tax=Rubroshorea leprosula TaxID=152421 RepID=A0AAV5IFG3_9ROSI|nr:hypothetical protein SLEP1_g13323 [Rubroshorea leprosula]
MISSPVSIGLHTRQLRFGLLEKFWKRSQGWGKTRGVTS